MIVSCKITFFVNVCSNMIEMNMFVSNGMILQNKISPIECENQNIFITDKKLVDLSQKVWRHWRTIEKPL